MSEQDNTAPAVWDPTARDGAGGWVRRGEPRTTPLRKTDEPPGDAPEERTTVLPPVPAGPSGPPAGPIPPQAGPEPVPTELDQPVVRPFAAAAGMPTAQPTPTVPNFATPTGPATAPPSPAAPTAAPMPGYGPAGGSPYAPPGSPSTPPSVGYPPTGYGPAAPPAQGPGPGAAPTVPGYPPPYRPGGPGYPPQATAAPSAAPSPAQPQERSNLPLLVTLVVVVAALLGVGAVWGLGLGRSPSTPSTGAAGAPTASTAGSAPAGPASPSAANSASASPSETSTAGATSQAQAVDAVLSQSSSDRRQVASAASDASGCTNLSAAQSAFRTAASDRQSLATKIGGLDVSQLPNGAAMMQSLAKAEQESASADNSFAAWAGTLISSGCTAPGPAPTNGSDYQAAIASSQQASTDKQNFVAQWNAIAGQYQLHQWTKDDI
ncbi:hypothetical protein [Streptacidiphilus rugosus]|uniref:hypothetical protein n=1 Tax=Streptacidiphilus rugosus TaxID=405783 RepID=UPI00056258E4|nr:hypothetical protein [Streptacidiphilus rugosus]